MLHLPILCSEILEIAKRSQGSIHLVFDGTFGRGGHTKLFLDHFPDVKVYAVDRDLEAIQYAQKHFKEEISHQRLQVQHGHFSDDLPFPKFDFLLLDLGVSSPQLDSGIRGFSFYNEGPLDMRMDQSGGVTAIDILNQWEDSDLVDLFQTLGEVRRPHRVVRAICQARSIKSIESTTALANLIAKTDGWKRKGHHPATQYFLALRLQVNRELESLNQSIRTNFDRLSPTGQMAVITFHSLEDRIVKYALRDLAKVEGRLINKKVIVPSREEIIKNPRSRSAKLRVIEKLSF